MPKVHNSYSWLPILQICITTMSNPYSKNQISCDVCRILKPQLKENLESKSMLLKNLLRLEVSTINGTLDVWLKYLRQPQLSTGFPAQGW